MKRFNQLHVHDPDTGEVGDCFRTAIACLIDRNPSTIPNFAEGQGTDQEAVVMARTWLRNHHGLGLFMFAAGDVTPLADFLAWVERFNGGERWILVCSTREGGAGHALVCEGGKIAWDPAGLLPADPDPGQLFPCGIDQNGDRFWLAMMVTHHHHEIGVRGHD